jgi:hypothetical protein
VGGRSLRSGVSPASPLDLTDPADPYPAFAVARAQAPPVVLTA